MGANFLHLERQLIKKTDTFVEFTGDYFAHGSTKEFIHFGMAYRLPQEASWIFTSA
jgi:hypothetical protein